MSDNEERQIDYSQRFLDYVEAQIQEYQVKDKLEGKPDVNYFDLMNALQNYQKVLNALISLSVKADAKLKEEKRLFQMWYDERFLEIRTREKSALLPAAKWASATELDAMTKVENKEEYLARMEKLDYYINSAEFIGSLKKAWEQHSYILTNMRALLAVDLASTNMS